MDDIIYANYSKLLRANINLVCLSKDKNVNLLKFFEINDEDCKKYLRSTMIMIGDEILTTNYTDTTQFIEELALFDKGNEQNRFFSVEQHKKGPFKILCQSGKITNTQGYRNENRNRCRTICKRHQSR